MRLRFHGPLIGDAGVISMTILADIEQGPGWVWASTFRGRPPGRDELERVQQTNLTADVTSERLNWEDTDFQVSGRSVPAAATFVPAAAPDVFEGRCLLLFGAEQRW
jgi:hypothetical protein